MVRKIQCAVRGSLTVLTIVTSCAATAVGETDVQLWTTGQLHHPISDRLALSLLVQGRFSDDISRADVFLLNPALHVDLVKSIQVGLGYDYFHSFEDLSENRLWQQIAATTRWGGSGAPR